MDLKWNLNGYWLATASRDTLIKVFDIRNMKELQLFRGHKKDVNGVCACVRACVCACVCMCLYVCMNVFPHVYTH